MRHNNTPATMRNEQNEKSAIDIKSSNDRLFKNQQTFMTNSFQRAKAMH